MSNPTIIGGAGLSKDGAGASIANNELQKEQRTYIAGVKLLRGDWVALNFDATEPTGGWGKGILPVDTDVLTSQVAFGVVVYNTEVDSAGAHVPGAEAIVQVEGRCDFAKIADAIGNPGGNPLNAQGLVLSGAATIGTVGLLDLAAAAGTGEGVPVATLVKWGTADTADSTVWLLNTQNQ